MQHLSRAILDLAMFIELSGDEVIDPDSAVRALEQLAFELQQADVGEIAAIHAELNRRTGQSTNSEKSEFLRNFAEDFGLPARE